MRKEVLAIAVFVLLLSSFLFLYHQESSTPVSGQVAGSLAIVILSQQGFVNIVLPENVTYNFNIGSIYELPLNVTSNFAANTWTFTLEDLFHNTLINQSASFTPNTTFVAARRLNRLTVYANGTGIEGNDSVEFYVFVPNSAPVIGELNNSYFACEGSSLSPVVFNVTDVDEDNVTLAISPTNPFFVFVTNFFGEIDIQSQIFSSTLSKSRVGVWQETLSATDGNTTDSKQFNITVIEVNNPPSLGEIGSKTVWTQGDNDTFIYQSEVSDIENGNQFSSNFTFNLTFLTGTKFFEVNNSGYMAVEPNITHIGSYNLSLCVTDKSIPNIHQNITFYCGVTGLNETSCVNFTLTVTDDNRAPVLTSYFPDIFNLDNESGSNLFFNASYYDPDGGTVDAFWLVDDILSQTNLLSGVSEFNHNFGCGISGDHNVSLILSDGLLNTTLFWNISLSASACPGPGGSSGGGGGGGGAPVCNSLWGCNSWSTCRHISTLDFYLSNNSLYFISNFTPHESIKNVCGLLSYKDEFCGYQVRSCIDARNCSTSIDRPMELQSCYYSEFPGCSDGIQNCHDGDCEVLVDCGGPCAACATCHDGIKNQNELGIDCGGPCAACILPTTRLFDIPWLFYLLLVINIILIILFVVRIIRLIAIAKKDDKQSKWFKRERERLSGVKVYYSDKSHSRRTARNIASVLLVGLVIVFIVSLYFIGAHFTGNAVREIVRTSNIFGTLFIIGIVLVSFLIILKYLNTGFNNK